MKPNASTSPLASALARYTAPGTLVQAMDNGWLRCVACGHRCKIAPGKEGICKVRFHDGTSLRVPWGYVAGLQADPIEKKPFFHAYPGSIALSFGMLGCDYHCPYCQNWFTSQSLRDPSAGTEMDLISPEEIVRTALRIGARVVTSTYNEPLITSEWAVEVFTEARRHGLATSYVSNGNATPEVLDLLQPHLDLYKIDLKGFTQKEYARLGGTLSAVLDTIRDVHRRGLWVEIVTLLVPGANDSDAEVHAIAEFIASVSVDIPWHVTAYHDDYRVKTAGSTRPATLVRAAEAGVKAGLRYVYAGNIPGRVGTWEDTRCHSCQTTLVQRSGFAVRSVKIQSGACSSCGTAIPGRWD
ncbi:MAG: AmmeMemoRadiSam system radical SAM enzyme [Bacteroidetes bacterium]|jgi:pyruvate formate lyase activating enzyme|nr:AmmeMemoRadiSam system radical SAM enzyme [Bacteroidota bacterium]